MMIFLEVKSVEDIKLGDLIELSRMGGLYAHWAVYVGDGYVIHLSPPPSKTPAASELCSAIATSSGVTTISGEAINMSLFGSIKVRRDKLTVVAAGSAIVVNNECDSEMTPYPGQTVVKRAESKLGTNDYNPLKWNCEHFATWCRYGKAVSKQVPFSKGLSNNAYLVQLPGIEVIPHGSLPEDIGIKGNIAVGHLIGAEGIPPERFAENMADVGNAVLRLALGIPPINQPGCAIM